jgi:hypothetical protein
VLLGVTAEHLIDAVFDVGPADAVRALENLRFLVRVLRQDWAVIAMPDRSETSPRAAQSDAVGRGRNHLAASILRRQVDHNLEIVRRSHPGDRLLKRMPSPYERLRFLFHAGDDGLALRVRP